MHRPTKVPMQGQDPYNKLMILLNTTINFYGINSIAYLFSTAATGLKGAELGDWGHEKVYRKETSKRLSTVNSSPFDCLLGFVCCCCYFVVWIWGGEH